MSLGSAFPARYRTLDIWRGLASFSIVIHHAYSQRGLFTEYFYLAVQLFFVISGYCLAAATHRALETGQSFKRFMKRRVRRIAPPYLASVMVALGCLVVQGWLAGRLAGVRRVLDVPWSYYATNFSMTQFLSLGHAFLFGRGHPVPWGTPAVEFLAPPYWSLNYEEQFYLIMGLSILLASRARPLVSLGGLTVVVVGINASIRNAFTGLFFDYWLQFAAGSVVYLRLCVVRTPRLKALLDAATLAALAAVASIAAWRGDLAFDSNRRQLFGQLTVCLAFAFLLICLRRFDERVSRARWSWPLARLGAISYSLYLIHFPLLRMSREMRDRLAAGYGEWVQLGAIAVVLGFAYVFFRLFEKPFLNSETRPTADLANATPAALPPELGA